MIKATDFMASMGIRVFNVDETGVHEVKPKYTEEEAIKKLQED